VSDLARLAGILDREGVDFRLSIVGSGMDEEGLAERVRALPEPARRRVRLRGLLPIDAMMDVWLSGDVCVLVSEYEGTSITMLEAMGCGCVPVVTDVSGTAAVIRPGENGFAVPVGDLDAMARVLKELASNRSRLASLGAAARATVEPWSFDAYVQWFLALAQEAWREPPRWWPADRGLLPKR
jgi:glycosyltransferase involved in cell wall biosynthesis